MEFDTDAKCNAAETPYSGVLSALLRNVQVLVGVEIKAWILGQLAKPGGKPLPFDDTHASIFDDRICIIIPSTPNGWTLEETFEGAWGCGKCLSGAALSCFVVLVSLFFVLMSRRTYPRDWGSPSFF